VDFLLNGKTFSVGECGAETTLLRFLRTQAGLPGTKEGCGSGDCGACTVLVAGEDGNTRSINACITPLGSVAGHSVVTVEGLTEAGQLHPAQQAMVDEHGSQCGFCTPGFVMSLAGLYQRSQADGEAPTREAVTDAISGNLCRCTGYRPIIDAGLAMQTYPKRESTVPLPNQNGASQVTPDDVPVLRSEQSRFYQPRTEAALQAILREEPNARLVSGGTDFMLEVSQLYRQFDAIVDITRVDSLAQITETDDTLIIGASAIYDNLMTHPALDSAEWRAVLHRLGSQQIRNRAGLGGNITGGSPIADTPPMLLCWEASVELVNPAGQSRQLALDAFYQDYRKTVMAPDEYLRCVHIPKAAIERPHRFRKLSKRFEDDISSVLMAASVAMTGDTVTSARIAYGGMAATPARAPAAEDVLLEQGLSDAAIEAACDAVREQFTPLSDVRASAAYRSAMAANLLNIALKELRGEPVVSVWVPATASEVAAGA
ncbi:MAG: xanthine dehydrogenase small subunit, partial [Pseudomonadota bacterium]